MQERLATWLRRAVQMLLYLVGNVPVHVAFVMDGNRRYAERQFVDKATGHTHGYGKMVEVIHWCIELGVKHITVYAFSIDNFKRSPDEVSALMKLAEEKYIELARDNGLAEREGIRMHIVGDLELLPPGVQGAAARLMRGTAALQNQRATLNVCFSYTSSEETVNAVHELQAAVRESVLQPGDVSAEALHGALRTGASCPPVDLLIRTSGETRLSDFLLWQASHAHLCYLPTLWPDMSYLDFAQCVLSYQRCASKLSRLRGAAEARLAPLEEVKQGKGTAAEAAALAEGEGGARAQPGSCLAGEESAPTGHGSREAMDAGLDTELLRPVVASEEGGQGGWAPSSVEGPSGSGCGAGSGAGRGILRERRRLGSGAGPAVGSDDGASASGMGAGSKVRAGWVAGSVSYALRWLGRVAYSGAEARWRSGLAAGQSGRGVDRVAAGAGPGTPEGSSQGSGGWGREARLLRFFARLEQARSTWIASHAEL